METLDEARTGLRTDALTGRVKRRAVSRFYRAFAEQHPSVRSPLEAARRIMLPLGALAMPIGLLALSFGISEEIDDANPDMVSELVALFAILGLFVYAGVLLCWASFRHRGQRGTPKRHYRLAQFAFENGMTYIPGPLPGTHLTPWKEPGMLVLTRVMRPASARTVEFANYTLTTELSGSRNSSFGGIVSLTLPNRLPHILLVANRRVLPYAAPAHTQVLSLEGNFDEHFTLYCPKGYEQDALYLFTPDVMAALIDRVSGFDVEIIDDWLFLESSRDVVTLDPETWHTVVAATAAVTAKIDRWAQWRDDRQPVPAVTRSGEQAATALPAGKRVAPRGRRLKMVAGNGAILAAILVGAYVAAVVIANAVL